MHTRRTRRTSAHQLPIPNRRPRMNIIPSKRLAHTGTLQRAPIRKRAALSERGATGETAGRGRSHRRVPREVRRGFGRTSGVGRRRRKRRDGRTGRGTDATAADDGCESAVHPSLLLLRRILEGKPRHLLRRVLYLVPKVVRPRGHGALVCKRRIVLVRLLSVLLLLLLLLMVLVQPVRGSSCNPSTSSGRGVLRVLMLRLLLTVLLLLPVLLLRLFARQLPDRRLTPVLVAIPLPVLALVVQRSTSGQADDLLLRMSEVGRRSRRVVDRSRRLVLQRGTVSNRRRRGRGADDGFRSFDV